MVNDHILHPLEPWERLLGVKFLNKVRQKVKEGPVSELDDLYQSIYDRIVPILDEGIQFSIGVPVYAQFHQERCRLSATRWYKTEGYFFLEKACQGQLGKGLRRHQGRRIRQTGVACVDYAG
jgi:hypothetical protein